MSNQEDQIPNEKQNLTQRIIDHSKTAKTPWYTSSCGNKECWCVVVNNANTVNDDDDYVLASGCISKQDADAMILAVNNASEMAGLLERASSIIEKWKHEREGSTANYEWRKDFEKFQNGCI